MNLNRDNFTKIALFVIGLLIASLCLVKIFYIAATSLKINIPWWFETPSVLSTMAFLYLLFDKYLWKWKPFKTICLIETPNLNGRWKGCITSSFHDHQQETPAALEIYQTSSSIYISVYLQESESKSLVAGFVTRENGQIELHYEYENIPKSNAKNTMRIHFGTTQLKYFADTDTLDGCYYSSVRDRSTYGSMKFKRESKELLRRF
jgi:hypothetical protein